MVACMEIISKEMIKPSIPTPQKLSNHSLSFLDQIAPAHHFPLIFFYQSNQSCNNIDRAQISQQLKSSFSIALTKFYPLAGRIDLENFFIDCNDAGASYIEAQVHDQLSEVMKHGKTEDLHQYLPINPRGGRSHIYSNVLVAVQINFFDCGGIAIGVCMSHKIADGTSLVMFMSSWAAICHGNGESVMHHPDFNIGSLHFPPQDFPVRCANKPHLSSIKDEKFVAKRLVFGEEKLAKLKKVISSSSEYGAKEATRVEAVTAFLWKRFMEVGKSEMPSEKKYAALHALNLRPRINPPLPEHTFGNIWRFVLAFSDGTDKEYHDLLVQLRNGIAKVNNECMNYSENREKNLSSMIKSLDLFSKEKMEICTFSSWFRFPIYEVDFGLGKPLWVCTTAIPFKNAVILMPTRSGDGIEAWVNMVEDEFEKMLKNDQEFTSLLVHE